MESIMIVLNMENELILILLKKKTVAQLHSAIKSHEFPISHRTRYISNLVSIIQLSKFSLVCKLVITIKF